MNFPPLMTVNRNGAFAVTNHLTARVQQRMALQKEISAMKEGAKTAVGDELISFNNQLKALHEKLAKLL
jgi:hypothetical protein